MSIRRAIPLDAMQRPAKHHYVKQSAQWVRDQLHVDLDAVLMLDGLTRCWGCTYEDECGVKNLCKYEGD